MRQKPYNPLFLFGAFILVANINILQAAKKPAFLSGNKASAPLKVWVAPTINTNDNKILPFSLRDKLIGILPKYGKVELAADSATINRTSMYYGDETSICLDLSCILEVGRQVQSQRVLYSQVTPNGKNWNVELRWLESPSGSVIRYKSKLVNVHDTPNLKQELEQLVAHVVGRKKIGEENKQKPSSFIVRRKMQNPKGAPKETAEKSGSSAWIWVTGGSSALAGIAVAAWYFIPKESSTPKINMSREVVLE